MGAREPSVFWIEDLLQARDAAQYRLGEKTFLRCLDLCHAPIHCLTRSRVTTSSVPVAPPEEQRAPREADASIPA
jgi:hypothetical protein